MSLWLRTLVILLLVMSVPLQGTAAAAMSLCGPHHEVTPQADVGSGMAPDPTHSLHAGGAGDAPASAPASATATAAPGAASDVTAAKLSSHGQHKCSACASCCSLSALLGAVLAVPSPLPATTVFAAVVPSVRRFAAEGPERPPRALLG